MGKKVYSDKVLQHSPFGFAYHKVLYANDSKPVDFIFLDVNASFERMLGYTYEDIVGKKASEVLPLRREEMGKWIEVVSEVLQAGKKKETEHYSGNLKKWFNVHIYSPEKDHFSVIFQDITSQKVKEEQLLISDKVFQHSMDMLCVAGNDGYFKSLNPAWSKTLGWDTEEMLSRPWIDFVHPDDKYNTENIKAEIVHGNEVHQFENRYRCVDGSYKWLSWNSIPLSDQGVIIGVARNITQLKSAERELKEILERNKAILEAIPDIMFVFDKEGVFVDYYTNDKNNLLMKPTQFLGKKDSEVLPGYLAKINRDALNRLFATGHPQVYSYKLEVDGSKKHFDCRMVKMGDDNALCIVRDITHQMDAQLLLAQSEEKFRLIFETAPLGILHFDCEGIVTSCNQKLFSITNSSVDKVIGVDLTLHPNKEIVALVKKVLAGSCGTFEGTYTAIFSGKSTPVKIQAAPIMKTAKQCSGGIAIIEDRTLHQEREEFERQMAVAREAVKFKQNFLANMSHEIRTPLTGIIGIIDILSQGGYDREYLEILRNTSENLLEVVNQVLDYSKIEAGKVHLRFSEFQFRDMIADLTALYDDIS
ncbi:MAG: PAS domain S-box protein, partial [Bacteroidota bacterium]